MDDLIDGRKYARGTKSRRESEEAYLGLIAKGMDPGAAQADAGIVSLINTGQLRNSITSVVRNTRKGNAPKPEDIGVPTAADIKAQANRSPK
jgi:hypothetical protein